MFFTLNFESSYGPENYFQIINWTPQTFTSLSEEPSKTRFLIIYDTVISVKLRRG